MTGKSEVSRRSFLKGSGTVIAASSIGLGLGLGLNAGKANAAVQWPLPYVPLDPEVVRLRGHRAYYEGECCYGAFKGILETLREEVGGPYEEIPPEIMIYGGGGVAGWGTTCGALIGTCSVMALTAPDKAAAKALANAQLSWYSSTAIPSDRANEAAVNGEYLAEMKAEGELPSSISGSPLCHVSVSSWCTATGHASGSPERAERCARLVGDACANAVILLNQLHSGGAIEGGYTPPAEAQVCTGCHTVGQEYDLGQFTLGKGDCVSCHDTIEEIHPSSGG